MSVDEFLSDFDDEDIVQFCPRGKPHFQPEMMKLGRFRNAIQSVLENSLHDVITSSLEQSKIKTYATYSEHERNRGEVRRAQPWLKDGVDCGILKLGSMNWQNGKVRLRVALEFVPDEIEENFDDAPLAEIRQEIESTDI
jgi:hypothetical protein